MKTPKVLTIALILTFVMSAAVTMSASAATSGGITANLLVFRGTTTFRASAPSAPATPNPAAQTRAAQLTHYVNRSLGGNWRQAPGALPAPVASSTPVDNLRPGLKTSFQGLNAYDSSVVNAPYVFVPPDQGLCAGNGLILEPINDAVQVYTAAGASVTGVASLNGFYNYPPFFNQNTGNFGPELTDPSCYFDHDTQRWFQVALTFSLDSSGNFTGNSRIDIAVSQTADPTGIYNLYTLNTTDDGTKGTPNHANCPCYGDYPQIGADANGFYISTNEFPVFNAGFNGAQVYAISKSALVRGATRVVSYQYENLTASDGNTAYRVWPAISPLGSYATTNGGTEFFLSDLSPANSTGSANQLDVWALTNTRSLNSSGFPRLIRSTTNSETYVIPPTVNQKIGEVPLAECLNTPPCFSKYFTGQELYHEREGQIDPSPGSILTAKYANGLLWGALSTGATVNGSLKAAVGYFAVHPVVNSAGTGFSSATVVKQGYLATANNNVLYPAIGVLANGQGVMAVNVIGPDYYPSAAYVNFTSTNGVTGNIHIAGLGKGPDDEFCEYQFFGCSGTPGVPRPRWGDYGGAAVDGGNVYIASEYIAQTCTVQQYFVDPTCGGTRSQLANFSTHISSVTP